MKKLLPILLILLLSIISCKQDLKKADRDNPFFTEYKTLFGVPPFDKIKVDHFMPAFEKGMEKQKEEVEAILGSDEEPTFENTIVAMDRTGKLLD